MVEETKKLTKKDLKLVRDGLKEVKEMAMEQGLIAEPEPTPEVVDPDAARMHQLKREDIFKNGLKLAHLPGVVFKGEEAVKMFDAMNEVPPSPAPEKVGGKLSDEDYAELAKTYFRVDIKEKPKVRKVDIQEAMEGEGDA